MLQLRIRKGPSDIGRTFSLPIGETFTIGRADGNEIRLASNGVSKQHAQVKSLSASKVEVQDLGSSNGTFVNGLMVKKHTLKPGDKIMIHEFELKLELTAPEIAIPQSTPQLQNDPFEAPVYDMAALQNVGQAAPVLGAAVAPVQELSFAEKVDKWLTNNVYPLADRVSSAVDLRILVGGFFALWSVLIVLFTAMPFSTKANGRVLSQSIEVAKLYARQLVRVNQQAIIDQRYRDLVGSLDARFGQTPGVISSLVLDVEKSQVLAPPDQLGQTLPNTAAQRAISKLADPSGPSEYVEVDKAGIAYVGAPMLVGTDQGNRTIAIAFVTFDTVNAQFSTGALLDQAVSSLLYSMIVSLIFLLFVFRWVDGSVGTVALKIDEAMKKREISVSSPVIWPALNQLCEQVTFALGRASGASPQGGNVEAASGNSEWATSAANASGSAAAAFSSGLTVLAWNAKMERLIGLRASQVMGADISSASRDVAFETAIRDLVGEASLSPWSPCQKQLEFAGVPHMISMVSGNGAFLVNISPVEG